MAIAELDLTMHPYEVADETFVIPWILPAPPVGLFPMNSLVIRGAEPVIVDTGSPANRDEWFRNVESIVDLDDVRWIFLSHDDRDHSGNLLPALERCPNAMLLTTWFMVGRMCEEWLTPLDRCRFLNDGESIEVGDRVLTALRPPIFDNPTTRGLFDNRTGVFWSVDTFATKLARPLEDAADLDDDEFEEGQLFGNRLVAPWHGLVDEAKFCAEVDRIQALPIQAVASCHGPALSGARLDRGFDLLRTLPTADDYCDFTQADLDQWMAAPLAE